MPPNDGTLSFDTMTKKTKMARYTFVGDVLCPGRVSVIAASMDSAINKMHRGDFEIEEVHMKHTGFTWNGDDDTVEIEDIK